MTLTLNCCNYLLYGIFFTLSFRFSSSELLTEYSAGYVREATRFKPTLDSVDVPSRDAQVIQEAVDAANSTTPPLPASIAKVVFEAILNASVPFEECVVGL